MFNFFLLNEAIDLEDLNTFKNGFQELITIKSITSKEDNLLKHASIWTLNIWPVFYVDNSQYVSVISKFVEQLNNNSDYLNDESTFDSLFPKMCNSFLGIDFSKTTILSSKWIKCKTTFEKFKKDCATAKAYLSINNFWEYREIIFPNLVFCEKVFDQIKHLSINDDRFKLIDEKLKKLNEFTGNWNSSTFDFKSIGLDCSPDTPKRIKDTLSLRTFLCPIIGDKVFSYHIKWSFGSEPFRLYFYPETSNYKVYVGYIGAKDEIGF